MAFVKKEHKNGEVLYAADMNKLENSIDEIYYETGTATTTASNRNTCTWQYHKYSDGRVECWGSFYAFLSGGGGTTAGGIANMYADLPSVPLPITLKDRATTQVIATCTSFDGSHLHYAFVGYHNPTVSNTGTGIRFGYFDGELAYIHLYVTGYWK